MSHAELHEEQKITDPADGLRRIIRVGDLVDVVPIATETLAALYEERRSVERRSRFVLLFVLFALLSAIVNAL